MGLDAMRGATVTITGGTGSFGSTTVDHQLTRGVASVHVPSRDEAIEAAAAGVRSPVCLSTDKAAYPVEYAFTHAEPGDLFLRNPVRATSGQPLRRRQAT